MRLSVEVLDHIFSFLTSHRETLFACSKDPVLSSIVERHLYYHTIVYIGASFKSTRYAFESEHLSRLVSENPRIAYHVKILELQVVCRGVEGALREFSDTLLMFSALKCIMIEIGWAPASLNALVDCLKLPAVKMIHVLSSDTFPLSWFDSCKNIQNLSLSGSFEAEDSLTLSNSPTQLKSLALDTYSSSSLFAGLQPHINKLQSLGCGTESVEMLPELLGMCSGTLTKLEVDLRSSSYYHDYGSTGIFESHPFPDLPSIPRNLQQLTIRTAVDKEDGHDELLSSYLPAASKIISLFISSGPPRHLALDIRLDLYTFADLALIDFSPLAVLEAACLSIPHIDLYVRTSAGFFLPPVVLLTHAQFLSSLGNYKGVAKSIEDGRLVIHMGKTAPDCISGDWISSSVIRTN